MATGQASATPATPPWAQPLVAAARGEARAIAASLFVAGTLLVLAAQTGLLPRDGLAGFIGGFLCLYGLLVALQRGSVGGLGPALRARLRRAVVSSGVGFYGLMTLARFLQLELADLVDAIAGFDASRGQLGALLFEFATGFSMQSLMNSIDAFLWPVKLMGAHGMAVAGLVVAASWSLYALGARAFPDLHADIEADDEHRVRPAEAQAND